MSEPTQEQIVELRTSFLKDVQNKQIHPDDLKKVKENDNWLRRFLLHHDNDHNAALKMLDDTVAWRLEQKANEIENVARRDILIEGGFFANGRDKDGCKLFIFKCKKHVKGQRDMDEVKRCVVYWLERLEREENGKPITLFFDMDQCGLNNMDLEFTKFLIHVMKEYYPFFLNYIIVFEMAWVLNTVFKVIKSWLPEKARQKIKMLKKSGLEEFVPVDQQLTCWGGTNDYQFSFVETESVPSQPSQNSISSKKVHFADGSQMSDLSVLGGAGDRENDGYPLSVHPQHSITFYKDGSDLVSTLELQNTDATINITYKMKTTSPEKFRVRPSSGCLAPGGKVTIHVTLLPGFKLGGLSKDKFLVMSMPVESVELSADDLVKLWKDTSGKTVTNYRLNCSQAAEMLKNGTGMLADKSLTECYSSPNTFNKLNSDMKDLMICHKNLQAQVKYMQIMQLILIILIIILGVVIMKFMNLESLQNSSALYCSKDSVEQP